MAADNIRVLVIEDDELDRLIIGKALTGTNICSKISFSEDSESALRAVKEKKFDFIFLDYNLPGANGLQLLKKIRETGITTPVVIITSQGDERIAVELMKHGAADYIPKNMLTTEGTVTLLNHLVFIPETVSSEDEIGILVSPPDETTENLTLVFTIKDVVLTDYMRKPYNADELLFKIMENSSNKKISFSVNTNTERKTEFNMEDTTSIIDMQYLKRVAEGEPDFIRDMIAIFFKRTPDAIATIRLALADGNIELVWQTAHRMKPSFSYMGMTTTSALAAKIEKLYKTAPDKTQAEEWLTTIENNFRIAQSLIEKEFHVTK